MKRRYMPHWENVPRLALVTSAASANRSAWITALASSPRSLDTSRWQRRGAHGFSWHGDGLHRAARATH
jgi:hypothetical protein